jgi:hypothetical protein
MTNRAILVLIEVISQANYTLQTHTFPFCTYTLS